MNYRSQTLVIITFVGLVALSGCATGNFQFAPGSVTGKRLVTEYHPNGQKKDEGWVGLDAQGNEVKTDQWQWWYNNGQPQWQGYYVNGAVDELRQWQEWNVNGSLRDTWIDD